MKIVFMGTPDFAVPVLHALKKAGHEIGYAVTQPDRKRNRGKVTFSPVKEAALELDIPVLQPEKLKNDEEVKEKIREYGPDALIVVAYGQILKQDVLDIPRLGCFNVHGSLLPKLRGASPVQHAILQGMEKTGVTIMKMGPGLDDGDMISRAETPVDHKNFEQLFDELSQMGAELLVKTLPSIEDGTAVYTPQKEEEATKCGMIRKQDGFTGFRQDPVEVERKIRAFDPWPGVFCQKGKDRIKLWAAEALDKASAEKNGTLLQASEKGIDIACGGKILRVTELQMPGKKRVKAADFLRGHSVQPGETFNRELEK